MKKLISVLLAIIMMLSAVTVIGYAVDTSYKPYENSQYYTYGDYDLHYRIEPAKGEYKGRILMIHGFLCSTYAWRNMATYMSNAGYECVMVDVPNFGYSTRETKDMEIVDRETLILSFMKSIAPTEEWIVAGHSMGGGIAVNIATMAPVKALMLYCPCAQTDFPQAASPIIKSSPMESIMNIFFKYGTRLSFLVKLVIFAATNNWQFSMDYDVTGVTGAVQYDGFGAGMCEMMYNVKPTNLDGAKNISCPVLLCQAEKDIILNDTQKAEMNETFPNATTYMVKGGGHQCIEDRADELSKVTLEFLAK